MNEKRHCGQRSGSLSRGCERKVNDDLQLGQVIEIAATMVALAKEDSFSYKRSHRLNLRLILQPGEVTRIIF